ncbi:hypothetical protein [Methylocapsa acidiphila]|uniref:hypothetical protein n=1 Tax=Methylocapsa acidiphila TaxID=133552 RepID=UPI00047AAD24|nr:hypothetical protein [Methylocapsa acidiphila]
MTDETSLPVPYIEAFQRLQAHCPQGVDPTRHAQALVDAAAFLAERGRIAWRLGWTVDDLFAPPWLDHPGGLVWRIVGGRVNYITPENAMIARSSTSVSLVRRTRATTALQPDAAERAHVFMNFPGD